jgi:hypothetical protein
MMCNKKTCYKTLAFLLWKITYHYSLFKIWFKRLILHFFLELIPFLENSFLKK